MPTDERSEAEHHIRGELTVLVRGGFQTIDEIHEWLSEAIEDELGEEDAELLLELKGEADALRKALANEALRWTKPTRNDALEEAFAELAARGILAMENAGYTQSDGWSDVNDAASRLAAEGKAPRGGAFYHGQDLARAIDGHGLYITFGAYEEDDTLADTKSVEVGEQIAAVLRAHGFAVAWDGSVASRIHTGPFPWRRSPR